MTTNKHLAAALRYAELGYRVFPCVPGTSKPLTEHGFHDASTDAEQIERWWTRYPLANVAISTEGLLVVDIDPSEEGKPNPWPSDPNQSVSLATAGAVSVTPRGGRHYVFRKPFGKTWRCTTSKLAPHVDTRTDGGYIVAPPSQRPDGQYCWAPDLELSVPLEHLPEPPIWLEDMLDQLIGSRNKSSAKDFNEARQAETGSEAGGIPDGQRNDTLFKIACNLRRNGLTEDQIADLLLRTNELACKPPLEEKEVRRIAKSAAEYEPENGSKTPQIAPVCLNDLVARYPDLRPPVIHGLLRQGETMNIISAPKIGKSWLVTDLALAVATGRQWLDTFLCEQGNVLIIDNELHGETSAHRIPMVAKFRHIDLGEVGDRVFVQNLRGHWHDIFSLGSYFSSLEPNKFKVVILDAMYRFMPKEMDENDNGTMANIYNAIDRYADKLGCCFVIIHHTSKGNQSGKSVTDVGAGAGAQSRATDTHLVLRPHENDDAVVLEAAVRSWPPLMPRCLRWSFPVWTPADDLDPAALRIERPRRRKVEQEPTEPEWSPESFTRAFIQQEPKVLEAILVEANRMGIKDHTCRTLLRKAESIKLVYSWKMGRGRIGYATEPPPEEPAAGDTPSKREQVKAMIRKFPTASLAEIARQCGVSDRYVRKICNQLKEEAE
jgi:hypothetical protein